MLLIAASLLFLAGQPESAGAPPLDDPWAVRPSLMATDYPQSALDAGLDGEATIHCRVQAEGQPSDCEVISEEPVGYGFGAAAVLVVQRGRISTTAITALGPDPRFTVRIPFTVESEPPIFALGSSDGVVTLRCQLGQTYRAEDCIVLEETPVGHGFGEAAIRVVEGNLIGQEAADGPRPGASFTVRIPFRRSED
jgi:TonB family protein